MTSAIHRELSVGLVQFQGKEYQAVIVYKGDSQHVPAAFSAAGRVNEIYRRTIQEMLDQSVGSTQLGSIIEISQAGEHFEHSDSVVEHPDPTIWARFMGFLTDPAHAVLPPVPVSIKEYEVLDRLYKRLYAARRDSVTPMVYTAEEQQLLLKLQIPAKTDPQDSDFADFRFAVLARYIQLQSQLTEKLYPLWEQKQNAL